MENKKYEFTVSELLDVYKSPAATQFKVYLNEVEYLTIDYMRRNHKLILWYYHSNTNMLRFEVSVKDNIIEAIDYINRAIEQCRSLDKLIKHPLNINYKYDNSFEDKDTEEDEEEEDIN